MPKSFLHIALCLVTLPSPLLQLLQNYYCYFCHCYCSFHTTLLLNTLLQILSYPGVVELTTQLLILENILWLEYSTLENCCDPLYLWVIIEISKIHTDLNVADPLTKPLSRAKHDQHQDSMGVRII